MKFTVTYAGHSAVFLTIGGVRVAIDPWLEGNPLCPPHLKNPSQLDVVVLTHGHADHASDAVRVVNKTGAKLLATYELAQILTAEGVPSSSVLAMNKGGRTVVNGLTVALTNAFHSSSFDSATRGTLYAGEACGVVVAATDASVYHAGDTCLFSDMALIGDTYRPDLALVPIGDCYTMGPAEAATAAKLSKCAVASAIHYKTFPGLTGTYPEFADECEKLGVESVELSIGEARTF